MLVKFYTPILFKIKEIFIKTQYFLNYLVEVFLNLFLFFKQKQVTAIVLYRQILFTGVEALTLIALTALIIGSIIVIQGNTIFPNFGSSNILYTILISLITRELGTLLPALFIISRSGAAIATEIGNMVLNEEVDALLSFGISPFTYLIVPRVVGVVVSMITLTIYFNIFGLIGSAIVAQLFYDISVNTFVSKIFIEMELYDIANSFIKSILFGFVIAIITTFQGFKVSSASTEVPQRTSRAVVQSISAIIIIDVILTLIFYV